MEPITIAALLGGGLGLYRGVRNEQRMKDQDKFRKAAITYSPWTGMGDPGAMHLPGVVESSISGAATGAMLGNAMGGTNTNTTTDTKTMAKLDFGTGQGQMMTPEMKKWQMVNQMLGGQGYTTES